MNNLGNYDVIIIGGGATGAGTARDCALRGLRVLLVERKDFATGATGRNHGLLHSGARYAVTDKESATECIIENKILRSVARHCVEETEGLFITLPEDDLDYQKKFISSCLEAGISAEAISPEEALRMEPSVNPTLIGAVKVPDGAIDPFRLVSANILDARLHGAKILTYHEVVDFVRSSGRIEGVVLRNTSTGEQSTAYAPVTVNAAGIWGHLIARKAGVTVGMLPAKGSLLVFGHRVNNVVINRCRKPANADILVPGDTICLIGTTSDKIPFEDIDKNEVTPEDVDLLLSEGAMLAPALAHTRILRAYAGVRPLVADDSDPSGRSVSRGIVCLDHAVRDGLEGFVTITGGKLMTYRLMAEWATDMVCRKLGRTALCSTATTPLPGSNIEKVEKASERKYFISMRMGEKGAVGRHGDRSEQISFDKASDAALVCECEQVSVAEVKYAIESLDATSLVDLRRRTRMGMGTCQGHVCAVRSAGILAKSNKVSHKEALSDVASFVNERWKGIRPIAWGDSLVEAQFTRWFYEGVCGLSEVVGTNQEEKI